MLSAQLMKSMTDGHLIASVRAAIDPMTSTPLELELIERFEALFDANDKKRNAILAEFNFELSDIKALGEALIINTSHTIALLDVIAEAGIDDPKTLTAELSLATKCRAILEDAGNVFNRLSELSTTTLQE